MDTSCVLPNEIWDDILGYVTQHDLKTLRLAGKWHLATLASSKLFTTAYIAARRGVIDALAGLANHPILRHHVKTFVFDSSYIDPEIHGGTSGDDLSEAFEVVHEDKLLALVFADQEYIQTCELRPAPEHAFKAFPNIGRVMYADLSRVASLPGDVLYTNRLMSDEDHPHRRRLLQGAFRREVSECCLAGKCGKKHLNFYRRQYGGLTTLLQVIHDHELDSVIELSLGSSTAAHYTGGIPNFVLHISAKTFDPLRNLVRGLRKLDITICFPSFQSTSTYNYAGQSTGDLAQEFIGFKSMLESSQNLEELYLSGEINVASLSLEHVWPDQTLGSLKRLHLTSIEASYSKLAMLIEYNRDTLHHLQLDDFNLLTKSWPKVSEFAQRHAPDLTVVYGYTWFQGITRSITWSPKSATILFDGGAIAGEIDEDGDDPEDASYSDGEDFAITERIVGHQRKENRSGDSNTEDSENEDVVTVVKELRAESDTESLEYDWDTGMSDFESNNSYPWD